MNTYDLFIDGRFVGSVYGNTHREITRDRHQVRICDEDDGLVAIFTVVGFREYDQENIYRLDLI